MSKIDIPISKASDQELITELERRVSNRECPKCMSSIKNKSEPLHRCPYQGGSSPCTTKCNCCFVCTNICRKAS